MPLTLPAQAGMDIKSAIQPLSTKALCMVNRPELQSRPSSSDQATSSAAGTFLGTASGQRGNSTSAQRSAAALLNRPVTPPPLKHNYGWSKFEPVRLKLIKRSEARYFLNFFIRQMHSFAPHCSPHLLDKSPEALSELVYREPILLVPCFP